MPINATFSIGNQDLLQKIRTSVLTEEQKRELEAMLPEMTETERGEISNLIDESVKAMIAADPDLQKKIKELNTEYNQKIQELVHHESRRVREGFEKLEAQTDAGEVQRLEGEMAGADQTSAGQVTAGRPAMPAHRLRRLVFRSILILIALAAAAGVLIYVFA